MDPNSALGLVGQDLTDHSRAPGVLGVAEPQALKGGRELLIGTMGMLEVPSVQHPVPRTRRAGSFRKELTLATETDGF